MSSRKHSSGPHELQLVFKYDPKMNLLNDSQTYVGPVSKMGWNRSSQSSAPSKSQSRTGVLRATDGSLIQIDDYKHFKRLISTSCQEQFKNPGPSQSACSIESRLSLAQISLLDLQPKSQPKLAAVREFQRFIKARIPRT